METEGLRWERNSSLKDMMNSHNRVVEQLSDLSDTMEAIQGMITTQNEATSDRLHELNDMFLSINYKVDRSQQEISDQLDDILRIMKRNHPDS